jgi:glycolate oxidase iron-sulfur subunit
VPQQSRCCGMPQIANGKLDTARQLAAFNVRVFEQYKCDYIISDCASCSSALAAKNMEFLFQGTSFLKTALEFSAKVMDLTKFLADVLEMKFGFDDSKQTQEPIKITYHDPCHLANAQKIKKQPRDIINSIPGVKLIEMKNANSCCGGSGTYSMTHYDLSMQILDKKMESIRDTGADIIATSCPSCTIQLKHGVKRHGLPCQVVHPVELLSRYC